jgi:predicted RNA-binding Zn ribbon-like protein
MLTTMSSPDHATSGTSAPVRGEPLAVELMNTIWADRDGVHDSLATARGATAWLAAVGDRLPDVTSSRGPARRNVTAPEAALLRELRDAIRRVAADITDDPRETDDADALTLVPVDTALSTVNDAAAAMPPRLLHRDRDGVHADRRSASFAGAVIAAFAVDAVPLLAGDHEGGPVRACLAPGCVLFFVQDRPRREWCSPACGNRARVARHYARTQSARRDVSPR